MILFLAIAVYCAHGTVARPEVTTRDGRVQGLAEGDVHVFRSIPYAAPPVAELRWRPPQPPQPWQGLRDGSQPGAECVQVHGGGDEDCLYLSVYTPALRTQSVNKLLPVHLWVHGGAFETGFGNGFNSTDLVQFYIDSSQPAVVVTINYRMNIFGFLGSDALRSRDSKSGSTGNYGMQDQRAAFEWVQANVGAFGGDRTRVMIWGESAGADSVACHLAMPRSAGLFSSAAIESGSFNTDAAQPMAYSDLIYRRVLNATGCGDPTCLQDIPAQNLTTFLSAHSSLHLSGDMHGKTMIPWGPTVDGVELTAHPLILAKEGKLAKVPILHGTNMDEAVMFETEPYNITDQEFLQMFKSAYKLLGEANATAAAMRYIATEKPTYPSPHTPYGFALSNGYFYSERSMSDAFFFCPAYMTSTQLAKHGFNVFQYVFSHTSGSKNVSSPRFSPFSNHAYEYQFVFMSGVNSYFNEEEKDMARQMSTYWNRFAATGDPNGPDQTRWPQYGTGRDGSPAYLHIDVRSDGGIRAVYEPFRAAQCESFMNEWIDRALAAAGATPEVMGPHVFYA